MQAFQIAHITVGGDAPPLVIPEIGINHGGDLSVAKAMVEAAYRAGARLIKHQTHVVDDEMSRAAQSVIPGNADISIYDIMEQAALSEEDEYALKRFTESLGLVYLSTPFSRAAADRLASFGVEAYKIGSGEMNNIPLLQHIASFGKPMIVSTGMNDMESIHRTVAVLRKTSVPFALMHTTNLYPTAPHQVRLGAMLEMQNAFPEIPIGLSDHTVDNTACIAAMALGAKLVERHFTDTMARTGPDIVCSMDENTLRALLRAAEDVHVMRGGRKAALPEEQVTMDFAFATVVATQRIPAGGVLTTDNIWVKRPGTGSIPAAAYETVLGRQTRVDIAADTHLDFDMLEPV